MSTEPTLDSYGAATAISYMFANNNGTLTADAINTMQVAGLTYVDKSFDAANGFAAIAFRDSAGNIITAFAGTVANTSA